MTDNQPANAVPDDATGNLDAVPFSIGTVLREARVHHGLSVDEVSGRIKFAPRQVEALEADDYAHLPEAVFLRGFVRSYARLLQLDAEPLLAVLPHAPEQSVPLEAKALTEVPFPNIYTERKQNIIWLAAALAVAVALALAAWLLGGKPTEQGTPEVTVSGEQNTTVETLALPEAVPISAVPEAEPMKSNAGKPRPEAPAAEKPKAVEMKKAEEAKKSPQVVAPPQPSVVPPAKPVVKPAATGGAPGQAAIRVTFDADSWVEIKDRDGKIVLSLIGHGGTEQSAAGTPPFAVNIGYASGVKLYYKGTLVDLAPYTRSEVAHLTLE